MKKLTSLAIAALIVLLFFLPFSGSGFAADTAAAARRVFIRRAPAADAAAPRCAEASPPGQKKAARAVGDLTLVAEQYVRRVRHDKDSLGGSWLSSAWRCKTRPLRRARVVMLCADSLDLVTV